MSRDSRITHKIMASIPQKNTKPELLLRRSLWHEGMRYRVNYRKLPGKPDIVFTRPKIAVFVDGDFWHGHNWPYEVWVRWMKNSMGIVNSGKTRFYKMWIGING